MPRKSNSSQSQKRNEENNRNQRQNSSNCNNSLNKMKMEIANDFGVKLGGESSSKDNGKVGGEMVKRLVDEALNKNKNKKSR